MTERQSPATAGAAPSGAVVHPSATSSTAVRDDAPLRADKLADVDGPDAAELARLDGFDDDTQPNPVDMVVFDIGNVLVHWRPIDALRDAVGEERAEAFLGDEKLDFASRNLSADGGRSWSEIIAEIEAAHPHHVDAARAYVDNFALAIAEPITGTVEILRELHAADVPLFAVTNFSAELFEIARATHGSVLDLFEEIVVSGEEGVVKPDPEIWEILDEVTRHVGGLSDAVFIDDSVANAMSADEAGLDAILFTDPISLREELRLRGLPLAAPSTF